MATIAVDATKETIETLSCSGFAIPYLLHADLKSVTITFGLKIQMSDYLNILKYTNEEKNNRVD